MAQRDGGVAFPHNEKNNLGSLLCSHPGMSLRDWFAGQALQGLLANPKEFAGDDYSWRTGTLVGDAYQFADAMLTERAKGGA